jgi:DNA transposition AAA+ family ATPase
MSKIPHEIAVLIEKIKGLLNNKKVTLEGLSRSTGLGIATINRFLGGDSLSYIKTTFEKLSLAADEHSILTDLPEQEFSFVETSVSRRVFELCKLAASFKEIAVITADSGAGKTTALIEYARQNQKTAILLQVEPGYTPKVLFFELFPKVCPGTPDNLHDAVSKIQSKLYNSGKLLIIDEAELLEYRTIELLRRLHDKAGIGIILAGMPRLINLLRGKRGEFTQLYSRVGWAVNIENISEHDMEAIVKSAFPSSDGLWKIFHRFANNNARRLRKLMNRAIRIAELNKIEINAAVVKRAAEMLIE